MAHSQRASQSPEIGEKDPGRRRRRRATTFVEVFRLTSLTSGQILTLVFTSRREEPAQSPPYKTVKVAGILDQSLGDSIQFRAFSGYTTSIRGLPQSLEYLNPTPFAVLYRYGRLKEVATIPVAVARAKAATVCTPMQADMSYPHRLWPCLRCLQPSSRPGSPLAQNKPRPAWRTQFIP